MLDQVVDDADTVVITRRNGGDVVVMSKVDYDGMIETLHLLGSEPNRKHLVKSIKQYRSGKALKRDLLE